MFEGIACLALAGWSTLDPRVTLVSSILGGVFGSSADVVENCADMISDASDGRGALQWATYTIEQGEHEGKTILAYMGTDFAGNFEQVLTDIWSVPTANYMMRNMADEAVEIAMGLDPVPDFITGHSLGGIIAEMVCSETGIPGASFAALGAFDPFSALDELAIDALVTPEITLEVLERYGAALEALGYADEDIEDLIENFDENELRSALVRAEYNGLLLNTRHSGVKFEVVLNNNDIFARPIGSLDGSECSHIARSCDIRWLWFSALYLNFETMLGHSGRHYIYNVNSFYTRGWDSYSDAEVDYSKIFLPGVQKNLDCDWCDKGAICESGYCNDLRKQCYGEGGKFPTFCPEDSAYRSGEQSQCLSDDECQSGRCDAHYNPLYALSQQLCYDQLEDGSVSLTCL